MPDRVYTFVFPNGSRVNGFRWNPMGWYRASFPASGIHSGQENCLRYTRDMVQEIGIVMEEHGSLCRHCEEPLPHVPDCLRGQTGK